MNKLFSSAPAAIASKGFWKAFAYSFGAWIVAWAITWFSSPEANQALGQFGWVIPMMNVLLVFFKQYFDAYQAKK